MPAVNDFNAKIIEEFREHGGEVGGQFEGAPLLLLHTVGAKSGAERINPMMYQQVGEHVAVFASAAGADVHPAWFHNVVANPDVRVEIGSEVRELRARVVEGSERSDIWEKQKADYPGFADYESMTSRVIPVVVLENASS